MVSPSPLPSAPKGGAKRAAWSGRDGVAKEQRSKGGKSRGGEARDEKRGSDGKQIGVGAKND